MAPLGRATVPRLSAAQPFSHAADEATSAWPASLDTQILGIQVRWMNHEKAPLPLAGALPSYPDHRDQADLQGVAIVDGVARAGLRRTRIMRQRRLLFDITPGRGSPAHILCMRSDDVDECARDIFAFRWTMVDNGGV
ncbi:hypothetical protein SNOG_01476 [Parastagonospora nodorum SN15]|uniref:Uncharacterized protein n=1 Tax=Phaeosphaeria nodorum (strain SN15 / ATCC MYA-4574 / FGSC 10173) TaxID=321614 RepID=Q0V3D8_PHANO|nr:hypothetical protein SNOG_01476 [Parastagonospora nodorum SN15]EAT91125.1 hypothetical protein SNOG_01476 [Parastagonospora nodorum SN15]